MNSRLGELSLAAAFPPASMDQWRRLALGALLKSGKAIDDSPPEAVDDILATKTYDNITVSALYTASAEAPEAGIPGSPPYTRGRRPLGSVSTGWDIRQQHAHPNREVTRKELLTDLEHGVTSLWLVLNQTGLSPEDLPALLEGVHLDLAGIVLDAGTRTEQAADTFLRIIDASGVSPSTVQGNLGADPLGLLASTGISIDTEILPTLARRVLRDYPGLRAGVVDATVYHDAGASDAQELGYSIATGVAYLRTLTESGLSSEEAFGQIEFRYAATIDQFLTIAKLRAARRLWARVAEVTGVPTAGAQYQHAVTSSAMMTARDPWVNMLRTTIACFAAGVGGADAVTVQPFDACLGLPDSFSRRIARNTQALLLEESNLAKVIDPAGGSWYVEKLTDDLAKVAWEHFTDIERSGGILHALNEGIINQDIDKTWAKRSKRIARRSHPITGVSEFPSLEEQLPIREPVTSTDSAGLLPRRRYSQVFEILRDRADAHPDGRPTVFLATIGSVATHTVRATFAANLFAAGGIATVTAGANTDAAEIAQKFTDSGLSVACLCSSDKLYADKAEEVAAALTAAGATKIWLAGPPKDFAGVDAYVFAGCDAVSVLETTLADLNVKA